MPKPLELDDHPDVRAAEIAAPKTYACPRTATPPVLDGRGACPAWAGAPWSDDFVDIQGSQQPTPRHRTRVRMLHDAACLYIHAELAEPHVWGSISRRNAVIFQDNDFEVFIDPDGDNHEYYELEVNALGTLWQLALPRPYRSGAEPRDPEELPGLRVAVAVDGTLNDPTDVDRGWSVEMSLPFAALARYAPGIACPPDAGNTWRINFSRVQWRHEIVDGHYRKLEGTVEDNWVWSPQGVIDMHRPGTWGRVTFLAADAVPAAPPAMATGTEVGVGDDVERARHALMGIWERMRLLAEPTTDRRALGLDHVPAEIRLHDRGWSASMHAGGRVWSVDHDARLAAATP